MRRRFAVALVAIPLVFVACGGSKKDDVLKIGIPTIDPSHRITIRTLEPGPSPTPTPTPTPPPMPPPAGATITSAAGTQSGAANSFCWSTQIGGPSECHGTTNPTQPSALVVKRKESTLVRIDASAPPDEESVRPFQGSRSGYPSQPVDPALETDLTVDLPKGKWSMDLCATWHGRGEPVCWLFSFDVR